ncbi:MAG: helix-turn-helix domain-containing protein [Beijerinckiaceae bacterium]
MSSLAGERLSFETWSRNCAAQMLHQKNLETVAFETARSHISHVTEGRCQFFADRPKLLNRFGYSEASLGSTRFQRLTWSSERVECCTATKRAQDLILYIPLKGGFEARQGGRSVHINPGDIFFVSANGESSRRWLGSSILLNVIIPRLTIARLLATDFDIEPDKPFCFPASANLSTGVTESFCRLLETILCDLGSPHSVFSHPGASLHAERAFLHVLIRSLPHNYTDRLSNGNRLTSSPPYLRRIENFIHDHIADELDIAELARVAGMSIRAVYYGFRQHLQTTPQRYLKTMRLRLAREALLAANGPDEKVSRVALRFGYSNAAQFSKDYRELFGVSPSEALRGSRAHTSP